MLVQLYLLGCICPSIFCFHQNVVCRLDKYSKTHCSHLLKCLFSSIFNIFIRFSISILCFQQLEFIRIRKKTLFYFWTIQERYWFKKYRFQLSNSFINIFSDHYMHTRAIKGLKFKINSTILHYKRVSLGNLFLTFLLNIFTFYHFWDIF